MEFTSKTVVCRQPGLSQEEALAGLYETYGDVRVASIKRRADAWVATIQKQAEFPPSDDGGDEKPKKKESPVPDVPEDDEGPDDADNSDDVTGDDSMDPTDDGPDGPPAFGDDAGPDKGDKGDAAEHQILHLLHEIAQALGVGGGHDKLAPGDEPVPPAPPGPPAPPAGPAGKPSTRPLKPGEVKPSQLPIGTPAFSSVQKTATMTVQSGAVNPREVSPAQAEASLNQHFAAEGYKVKQLRFDAKSQTYQALLSIH